MPPDKVITISIKLWDNDDVEDYSAMAMVEHALDKPSRTNHRSQKQEG